MESDLFFPVQHQEPLSGNQGLDKHDNRPKSLATERDMPTWLPRGVTRRYGYTLFLGVCGKGFLDEIGIWISRLGKADSPPQCGWASSNPWGPEQNKKVEKGTILLSLPDCWPRTWVFCPWMRLTPLALLVPRASDLDGTTPAVLLGLRLTDGSCCRTSSPPPLHEPIHHDKCRWSPRGST